MEEIIIARLNPEDLLRLQSRLLELGLGSSLEGLFWLPLPEALLNETQAAHRESCGPHALALDTDRSGGEIALEPLVRAGNHLHCECIAAASPEALEYMTNYLKELLRELSVNSINPERRCQA